MYLQLFFNFLLLLLWIRLWSKPEREFYFNPFLSGTIKLIDSVLLYFKPVFFLPEQLIALVLFLFLILFKTILFHRLAIDWNITLGANFTFAAKNELTSIILFSTLHTTLFILRCWTVYLLLSWITPTLRMTRAIEACAFFARPFSWIPRLVQPFALLALYGVLALIVTRYGHLALTGAPLPPDNNITASSPFLEGPLLVQLLKTGWLAAAAMTDGLMCITRGLFALIIANLGASILQARNLSIICNEGIELLLGRFARRSLGTAGFDFTPLIFFFVVDLIYNSICRGFYELIHSPFFN